MEPTGSPDPDKICQNKLKTLFSIVHSHNRPQRLTHPTPVASCSGFAPAAEALIPVVRAAS
jgi:hypothetical protein